ncbi:hypothetical protein NX059_009630 [Plenodomus lindquistii]|nr:hypothetical protein NX059_009630 [Plenodomus lindquistii]
MAGIVWLWRMRQREYLWLMDGLFLPGCLNAITGLVGAVVNVHTARGGHWSGPAVTTSVLMGTCALVFAALYAAYSFVVLPQGVHLLEHASREDVQSEQAA